MSLPYVYYKKRPTTLSATFVKNEYSRLLSELKSAEKYSNPNKFIKAYSRLNALDAYVDGEASRLNYKFSGDMSDKKLEARDKYFDEKIFPILSRTNKKFCKILLNSKHKQAFGDHFGQLLVTYTEISNKVSDPINIDINIKLSALGTKYSQLLAKQHIVIDGKKYTLSEARKFADHENESIRKEAYEQVGNCLAKIEPQLQNIFSKMTKLRSKLADNLNYPDFIKFRYDAMGRLDWSQSDAEAFRDAIHKNLTPLWEGLNSNLMSTLGKKELKPWDVYNNSSFYHPNLKIDASNFEPDEQVKILGNVFSNLDRRFYKHLNFMNDNNLIDLEARQNKRGGGFCTSFPDMGTPAIFCNSNGSLEDITTLAHEMGHAIQQLESNHIEAISLQWPTTELCEIHSMGMEMLCIPKINEVLSKQDAKKYSTMQWWEIVGTLLYVCAVDEFQHNIYSNPEMDGDALNKLWFNSFTKYLPGVNYSGYEKIASLRWLRQSHIFQMPFYYLDYALAQICAIQLGMIDAKDHKKAMNIYLKLCKLGGTKSFLEALKYAGLESPFQEETIKKTAKFAAKKLSIKPVL